MPQEMTYLRAVKRYTELDDNMKSEDTRKLSQVCNSSERLTVINDDCRFISQTNTKYKLKTRSS